MNKKKQKVTGKKISSTNWLNRHINDPYVHFAKQQGYRSRSAFKLLEIDKSFSLLKECKGCVIDIGSAPGGWLQVIREKVANTTHVLGVDLQTIHPIDNTTFFNGDFTSEKLRQEIEDFLRNNVFIKLRNVDLILTDMAPSTSGDRGTDHIRIMLLAESAANYAIETLRHGGNFVAKIWSGNRQGDLISKLKHSFKIVEFYKPNASYKDSSEIFIIARGLLCK